MRIVHESELEGTLVKGKKGEVVLKDIVATANMVAGVRVIAPHSDVPARPHKHEDAQIVYIINGITKVFNGSETQDLKTGDFVVFEPSEEHFFTSGDEEVVLFEVKWKQSP